MKKADWLILAAAAGTAAFFLLRHTLSGQAVWVVVDRGESQEARYPLYEDGTYLLEGTDSDENLLEIKDGRAGIIQANCPDELCVRQGYIEREGESIICLPHKLVVRLEGQIGSHDDISGSRMPDATTN